MTYDARERSADQGRPLELYTFRRDYLAWRYTSADREQLVGGDTFPKANIRRGDIEQGGELNRSGLRLSVPRDFPIAELYRVSPPTDVIALTLQRFHLGDGELATIWTGRVMNVEWGAGATDATILCEPIGTSMRRVGLRRHYGAQCPHVLYGPACALAREAWAVAGPVTAIAGNVITAAIWDTLPDGYFDGGYVEWDVAAGIFERRFIKAHTNANLTLVGAPGADLALAAVVRAYPGCDHSLATCASKFGNEGNYGGVPFVPKKNPFAGDPVY